MVDISMLRVSGGFHFPSPPPSNIADHRYLQSQRSDEVLGCALANLQQGRFDVAPVPMRLVVARPEEDLWVPCTTLTGYAAPMPQVKRFVETLAPRLEGAHRYYVCEAAMASGGFWAAATILDAYAHIADPDLKRFDLHALSWLLEEHPGEIWNGPDEIENDDDNLPPGEEPETTSDWEGYLLKVSTRIEALRAQGFDERSVLAEGRLLNIGEVAVRLLQRLQHASGSDHDRIEKGRLLLEAATGWDCAAFYDTAGVLQPLRATAIVEEFLDSGEAARYEPGVRYFFGHRIPD